MAGASQRLKRLRWLCRRGMKELDVLLEAFLQREEPALAAGAWPDLEVFLQTEDDILWAWLQGRASPPGEAQRRLIEVIRG